MLPTLLADPLPMTVDDAGTIRVGSTRVLLDLIIQDYQRGLTAQQIAENYSTIDLADVYAVLAYYLRHRAEIDLYMERRREEADALRQKIEAALPPAPTLQELTSRRDSSRS